MADEDTAAVPGRPAAEGSQLQSLRERRQAAEKKLHIDLVVPRLDPPVFVRFNAVPIHVINAVSKQYAKSKDPEVDVIFESVILTRACAGVFEVVDGQERSIDPAGGEWPTFGEPVLAELLGLPVGSSAVDVVRGLYLTDGDIMATGAQLREFSGYSAAELERDFEGN
jgi:hypothetical protein